MLSHLNSTSIYKSTKCRRQNLISSRTHEIFIYCFRLEHANVFFRNFNTTVPCWYFFRNPHFLKKSTVNCNIKWFWILHHFIYCLSDQLATFAFDLVFHRRWSSAKSCGIPNFFRDRFTESHFPRKDCYKQLKEQLLSFIRFPTRYTIF